jgi:hypothetical protein
MAVRHALQTRGAEEGVDRIGIRMGGRRPDAGQRQMCEAPRERLCKASQQLSLFVRQIAQFFGEELVHLGRGDTFKGIPQVREPASDGARRKLTPQARKTLIDGRSHRREAH